MLSRKTFITHLTRLFSDQVTLTQQVNDTAACPDTISGWLGRLQLLYGAPFPYLVPDEQMLPPESIRFFYLDTNWIDALADGAFSIGRNLSTGQDTVSMAMDIAATPLVGNESRTAAAAIRAKNLGVEPPGVSFKIISGFLLRSSLVQAYPGLGVNAYPAGGTPDDPNPDSLVLLRMERLGPDSDTLLCLVEGDIYRVDIHEAPEALHYGIDSFEISSNVITSQKTIYRFRQSGDPGNSSVTMDMDNPIKLDLAANNCFRTSQDPRTIKMQALAGLIASNQNPALSALDSSETGFEMIEGVGMVSFINKKS